MTVIEALNQLHALFNKGHGLSELCIYDNEWDGFKPIKYFIPAENMPELEKAIKEFNYNEKGEDASSKIVGIFPNDC
jgi:hypothetical protein